MSKMLLYRCFLVIPLRRQLCVHELLFNARLGPLSRGGFKMEARTLRMRDDAEQSAVHVLREKLRQRINIKNSGNGGGGPMGDTNTCTLPSPV